MIILVCGGRGYGNKEAVFAALDILYRTKPITLVVAGGALGADTLAEHWAIARGIHYARVPALWRAYGKAAGYRRNAAMLQIPASYCVAFPGGRGTEDMKRQAAAAGLQIWEPMK